MKERIRKLGYWLEDRLKGLCGELTPDKRITAIVVMLLILTIGNLYFTFSTIYNWGKDSEKKKQPEPEHIRQPELERKQDRNYDFMDSVDSEIEKGLLDLHQQKMKQGSSISINEQRLKLYERTIKNKYGAKAEA
ncbi:DUF3989 domain-containing protein [Dysgonomonas sp. 521]|uniref:TraL conjugative transposon family protein n=1 Tax=Dysgonomonas sp. 521 TaxID=2302932 RepID=UPI0013D64338|nr:TraL conjugative transposon family protein [Dysgonomonas sp. 521]NDV96631.1 DUF3989 domain-containing protein [Dysgonomonas sp. 521]